MNPPKAVLFDLGGTLLHEEVFKPDAWAEVLCGMVGSAPAPDVNRVRTMLRQLVSELRQPSKEGIVEVRMEACLRHLQDRLGLALRRSLAELELAFWQATCRMAAEPGVRRVLKALYSHGVAMGVVSNSMFRAEVLAWELGRHKLAEHFRFVLSSADYGLRKPHPSLFLTALARLGVGAGEVWFVGDSFANDVAGAGGVGMKALWYNPSGSPAPTRCPHQELRSWEDFLPLCAQSCNPDAC